MSTLTRRRFLQGAAACAVAGVAAPAEALGPDRPATERPSFVVPGLDPAHDGLRVAQLSDLHVGARTPPARIRAAIDEVNAFAPDLVVLTGDYVCRDQSGVAAVREQVGGLAGPVVAVLGNHDHWVDGPGVSRALVHHGYDVLRNQNTTLRLRGVPFTVVGIDDLLTDQARPREALAGARRGSRLAIAHGPKTAEQLRALGEPLVCLAGHTHGGQINIPGLTSFFLRALAHEPYDRGLFRLGPVQLYVSRGVGNSALRIRVNSAPEVTLATLRAPGARSGA
jgi:uncharacterized protein